MSLSIHCFYAGAHVDCVRVGIEGLGGREFVDLGSSCYRCFYLLIKTYIKFINIYIHINILI